MELRDYLNVARRHWVLITAAAVLTVLASAIVTAQATPQYSSKARLFVSTTPSDSDNAYQGGLFSQQRVASYADIVKGSELADRVVDDLDLNINSQQLLQKIQARTIPETVLIEITVTDPDSEVARHINQSVVRELQRFVAELETPPGGEVPLLKATVIDPPGKPTSPVTPRPARNLGIGLILGLLLGFGLAVVRELLDNSVKSAEDVPEVADVPILAHLPEDPDVPTTPLITSLSSHAPRVEAFRVLRTNLQFVDVDSASKAMVFTSSLPGEGKSTTSINAALVLAQAGRRVLLIDADMRRPQIGRMLGLEASVGLTTVLLGRVTFQDAVQLHGPSGLHVLTAGVIPPNPAELLQSQAMADLIAVARESFDVILFDAPPLLPVTDAALIAAQTDGAVLVIRHGMATKDQVASAAERLASVDAQALGLVFNVVPRKRTEGNGYGYGYAPEETPDPVKRRRRLPKPGERKSTAPRRRSVRVDGPEGGVPAVRDDTRAGDVPRAGGRETGATPVTPPLLAPSDPLSESLAPGADRLDEPTPVADAVSLPAEETVRRPLRATPADEADADQNQIDPEETAEAAPGTTIVEAVTEMADEDEPTHPDSDAADASVAGVDAQVEVDDAAAENDIAAAGDVTEVNEAVADADDQPRSPLAWAFARDDEDEDPSVSAWASRER